jgi:hypothetical protein
MSLYAPRLVQGHVLRQNFAQYARLLESLAGQLPGGVALGLTSVRVARANQLAGAAEVDLPAAVDGARQELEQTFTGALQLFGPSRPVVVLLDEFEAVAAEPVGAWFLQLAGGLRNALVVLSHQPAVHDPLAGQVAVHKLDNLSLAEVTEYLERVTDPDPVPAGVAEAVLRFSGGHPGAVALSGDWIRGRLDGGQEVTASIFRGLSRSLPDGISSLVDRIIDDIKTHDDELATALENAWVLRQFDAEALFHVSTQRGSELSDAEAKRYGRLLKRLEEYSFVTEVPRRSEKGPRTFRFHEFVRSVRDDELAQTPGTYEGLHQRAADYYEHRMDRWHRQFRDEHDTPYLGWYRYENPEWRALQLEWFHHVRHLSTDRSSARLAFVELFLNAFWWWGLELRFEFCDDLLGDWELNATEDDEEWTMALRAFYEHYPTAWSKVDEPDWRVVRRSMETIRRLGRLERVPVSDMTDRKQRHVRGLTCLFLAYAAAELPPAARTADQWYVEALECFEANGDQVPVAWTTCERGTHLGELGQHGEALRLCGRALEAATSAEMDDAELAADACQALGRVRVALGELERGIDLHGAALFHAYRFQVVPSPPDEYTRHHYRATIDFVTGELVRCWREIDGPRTLAGCQAIRARFAPYWEAVGAGGPAPDLAKALDAGDAEALGAWLAPASPDDDDLRQGKRSAYYERTQDTVAEMGRRLPERRP